MAKKLKACRNCGGKCDPAGWMRGDGLQGPECEGCGITAPDVESWNRLMGEQATSQGGEAVGEVRPLSDGKQYAALYTMAGQHLVGEKLYTHPADQVAEGVVVLSKIENAIGLVEELRALLATTSPQ